MHMRKAWAIKLHFFFGINSLHSCILVFPLLDGFNSSFVISPIIQRDVQALPPFTIKQILEASVEGGKYRIDGREVGQATIVGIVMQAEVKSTDILYTIDDGTGSINVRQYIDEDQQQQGVPNIP